MKESCSEISRHLTHHALGELDGDTRRRVEDHLATCAHCGREAQKVSALLEGARALPAERVSAKFHDRLIARVRNEINAQRPVQSVCADGAEDAGEEELSFSLRDRIVLNAGFVGYRLRQSLVVRTLLAAAAILMLSLLVIHALSGEQDTSRSPLIGEESDLSDESELDRIDVALEENEWRLPRSPSGRAGTDLNIEELDAPEEDFPAPRTESPNPFDIAGELNIPDDDIRTKVARENTLELGRYRMFARSNALCKTRVMKGRGGDQTTTYAVDRGLRWLRHQQEEDGSWDPEISSHSPARELGGDPQVRVGLTALAVAAFLSDGHSETSGKYAETVSSGINYILAARDSLGRFGAVEGNLKISLFNQSVCVLVLAENYVLSGGKNEDDLRLGISRLVSMAHTIPANEDHQAFSDTWAAMALRTALMTGLDNGDLPEVCQAVENRVALLAQAESSAGIAASAVPPLCSAGKEAVHALFVFDDLADDSLSFPDLRKPQTLFNLLDDPALREPCFLFLVGTPLCEKAQPIWAEWNSRVKSILIDDQERDGSWLAGGDWPWIDGGDVYTSSLSILTLQVYYRFIKLEENCP